jgi:hypothetical protein
MSAFGYRALLVALVGFLPLWSPASAGVMAPSPYIAMTPGYDTTFNPVCLAGSHYACRTEPFGTRFCGCWLGGDRPACPSGYFFACGQAPNGPPACGCY